MSIYGNPVTLGPRWMTAKKVSILPYQNLHGYDHPWPAGGGKNLLNMEEVIPEGTYSNNGETFTYNGGTITRPNWQFSATDVDVIVSFGTVSGTILNPVLKFFDSNGTRIANVSIATDGTQTVSAVCSVQIDYQTRGSMTVSKPMIRLATGTDPSFAPYSNICPISGWEDCQIWVSPTPNPADGTTYQILFGNPPGTVYGGELDLTTGVLTVDRAIVDMGSMSWVYASGGGGYYRSDSLTDMSLSADAEVICSAYKRSYSSSISGVPNYGFAPSPTQATVFFKDSSYGGNASAFTLGVTGQTICYTLATPVTYQLTPQQISFLSNQYFGANCGPVLIKVGK